MNSTISRLALAVPVTAAILGWSLAAAQAAPYEPSDHIEVQPAEKAWPADIVIEDPDDVDEPEEPPADEPTEEPADESADEPDEDSNEESDEDAAEEESSDNSQFAPVQNSGSDGQGSNGATDSAADRAGAEADVVETASSTDIAPPFRPAGVRVPLLMVVGAGALLTGVAGWASYRRYQLLAH